MTILHGNNLPVTCFQHFWQLVGRYCSYLLPRQYGGTSQVEVNRRLLPRKMVTLYGGCESSLCNCGTGHGRRRREPRGREARQRTSSRWQECSLVQGALSPRAPGSTPRNVLNHLYCIQGLHLIKRQQRQQFMTMTGYDGSS